MIVVDRSADPCMDRRSDPRQLVHGSAERSTTIGAWIGGAIHDNRCMDRRSDPRQLVDGSTERSTTIGAWIGGAIHDSWWMDRRSDPRQLGAEIGAAVGGCGFDVVSGAMLGTLHVFR